MTQMTSVPQLLPADRPLLEVVREFSADTPWPQWRPQFLVPATIRSLLPSQHGKTRIIALVNQKGGSGKTTSTVELAAAYAARGLKVLIIDVDAQDASCTSWLFKGFVSRQTPSLLNVYERTHRMQDVLVATKINGVWLVPSDSTLIRAETDPTITGVEMELVYAIRSLETEFDVILVDCGPSLGSLAISALNAAHFVVIPTSVSAADSSALASITRTIQAVTERGNPELYVRALVCTDWSKIAYARQLANELAAGFPNSIIGVARRTPRAAEAPATDESVRTFDPSNPMSSDYDQLATLLLPGV